MDSTLYPCPLLATERSNQLDQVITHIGDLSSVKDKAKQHKIKLLMDLLRYGEFWHRMFLLISHILLPQSPLLLLCIFSN